MPRESLRSRYDEDDSLDSNYFDSVELAPMGERREEEEEDVSYVNRVHSIHRNRVGNSERGSLERTIEARTGGPNGGTSIWRRPTSESKFDDFLINFVKKC